MNVDDKVCEDTDEVRRKYCSLDQTFDLMTSKDYKVRFVAEYVQTKIRYQKLHNMLVQYDAAVLDFQPVCPIEILRKQASVMGSYLYVLETRAAAERIKLPVVQVSYGELL